MNACCDGTRLFDSNVETEANHFAASLLQSSELPILCPIFSFDLDRWKWTIVMRPILFSAIRQIVVKFAWHWRRPNCDDELTPRMPTNVTPLWTQHRQLDYANNSVGSGRPWTTRIVGITFTFTAALDSCSMTASTGASNSYLNERRLGAARRHGKCQRDQPGLTFLASASSELVGSIGPTMADRLSGCRNLCGLRGGSAGEA